MSVDYLVKWECRYCSNHHQWWMESIDIPDEVFDVSCKKCHSQHKIRFNKNTSYCEVVSPTKDGVFLNIGVKQFLKFIPEVPVYERHILDKEEFLLRWAQHDALHYISGNPFTDEGERKVAYLENVLHCGWTKFNDYSKHSIPCEYKYITKELVNVIADQIKEHL